MVLIWWMERSRREGRRYCVLWRGGCNVVKECEGLSLREKLTGDAGTEGGVEEGQSIHHPEGTD